MEKLYSIKIALVLACAGTGMFTCSFPAAAEEPVLHPADMNADWKVVLSEAIAYLSGWQQGSNPMNYAIRAAYIWQGGERYNYDAAEDPPLCWELQGPTPEITAFTINNDAVYTSNPTVTLNNEATNDPTEYIASGSSAFNGASWLPYDPAPVFSLSGSAITQRIYFKVRNGQGESSVKSDTIYLEPAMIPVSAGVFIMGGTGGGDDEQHGFPNEVPTHSVSLSSYLLGKYEVTTRQYCDVLNWAKAQGYLYSDVEGSPWAGEGDIYAGGAGFRYPIVDFSSTQCYLQYIRGLFVPTTRTGLPDETEYSMAEHPMVEVSWYGAVAFCNWLSQMLGQAPCYYLGADEWPLTVAPPSPGGYRLPTEAEWERAAAWDTSIPKHWIYGFMGDTNTGSDRCNDRNDGSFIDNPLGLTAYPLTSPVGWFDGVNISPNGNIPTVNSPSPVGAYDMSGNVNEWCQDWYTPYTAAPQTNPLGDSTGTQRSVRSGTWQSNYWGCRTAYRMFAGPSGMAGYQGFRLSRSSG